MSLVTLQDVSIGYRGPVLLQNASCRIDAKQRIGLLGRNGAGKTTLMRLVLGLEEPDRGEVLIDPNVKSAWLPQEISGDMTGSVLDVVLEGLKGAGLQDWDAKNQVEQIASRMNLDLELPSATLSSGMKRRVLLAKAIVSKPDLLLLDEPTNHLDIDSICWLEGFLKNWPGALLFVTHDRAFLRKLATRILEIDRGRIYDWTCDYDTFLVRKRDVIAAEEKQDALFDKRLAEEEVWIRQGIKARRTRNEGRVRSLERMRLERSQRREKVSKTTLEIQAGQPSGVLVAQAKDISFAYPGQKIVSRFSALILRGDKIGVIGPNGIGKTTLIRLLLGELEPDSGSIRLGTNLKLAYFDQLRQQLDDDATVQENVGGGARSIVVNGKDKHVLGYLQDFLFTPERARMPVKFLSGGERHRILLAKLFAKPANVIVLDEPTNDLDAETLELLEERLVSFDGTVIVVSHDREFLNHVVTSSIVFENGGIKEYDGGYDDWLRQKAEDVSGKPVTPKQKTSSIKPQKTPESQRTRKLSFKEKQELAKLPDRIEELSAGINRIHEEMSDPAFYQQAPEEIKATSHKVAEWETELAAALLRWEMLVEIE